VLRVKKGRDRKDLICQFVAIATEEGQNIRKNNFNHPLRINATFHDIIYYVSFLNSKALFEELTVLTVVNRVRPRSWSR
jgi:hypothetical protein